jgi:hypothetical protein
MQITDGVIPWRINMYTTMITANHLNICHIEIRFKIFMTFMVLKINIYFRPQTMISLGDIQFRVLSCKVFGKNTARSEA